MDLITVEQARNLLPKASRIMVTGVSGGGKSTLSQKIAARHGLRYVSIDRDVFWQPGWVKRDRSEQRDRIARIVSGENWVIDGTNVSSFDLRVPRAQLVIWLRMPRRVALTGVARRVWTYRGQVRPDMAEGCPEQVPDREFLRWIWRFERDVSPRIETALERYGPVPVVILRSRAQVGRLLNG